MPPPPAEPTIEAAAPTGVDAKLKPPRRSPFVAICLYLMIVFVGTAVVAPRMHATAQFLFQEVSWRFGRLASQPFQRFLNGTFVLLAVVALPSLLKSLQLRSVRDLGFRPGLRHCGEAIQGIAWAVVSFLLLSALLVASNVRSLDLENGLAQWRGQFVNLAVTSLIFGCILEIVFRGAFFTALRRVHPFWPAAVASTLVYVFLSVLQAPGTYQNRIDWTSGFEALRQVFAGVTDPAVLIPACFNLALFGVLLSLALERTGALHFSVGLQVGALFCVRSFRLLTNATAKETSAFWGSDRLIDGWVLTVMLFIIFLLVERTLPARKVVEA